MVYRFTDDLTIHMNMTIIITMNIYITKANEDYLRSLQGSMSGYINGLIVMDKEDSKMVRDHVVKEGRDLGILPPVPKPRIDATKGTATPIIPQPTSVNKYPSTVLKPAKLDNGICKLHGTPLDSRGKCLQKGCKYA